MEKITDSHAHIYLEQFDKDRDDIIERAIQKGITKIMMPNVEGETIDQMLEAEHRYPDTCIPMMGLHPCSVNKDFEKELYLVEEWLNQRSFAAVGEIGTDLYWDRTYWEQQQEALRIQMKWAGDFNLPAVLHCRDSIDETIELVDGLGREKNKGIFHCFGGTLEQAQKIIDMGFVIGIGGVATFKNGRLDGVLKEIPLESIVLETDSPYLAPVPYRGKRNEPAFIELVMNKIANIKEISAEEVARVTTATCITVFGKNEI